MWKMYIKSLFILNKNVYLSPNAETYKPLNKVKKYDVVNLRPK